jgi:MinD superfamily P-loop ATPase
VYNIDQEQCKLVGDCVAACPIEVIAKQSDGRYGISEDCTDCAACEPVCDNKAIRHA